VGDVQVQECYEFFCEKERTGESFTLADLATAVGWKPKTVSTYPSKKWDKILKKLPDGRFNVVGVLEMSADQFARMHSQANRLSSDPLKPELPVEVERFVVKARQAAMLALDIYNRPATLFKTEGFVVMMIIAWTSLLHAIFERRGTQCFYTEPDGSPQMVDGDEKAWELARCIKEFYPGITDGVTKNLEFMIGLRNKIEHRFAPAIDPGVVGCCQAMLLNFDDLLSREFGAYYAIRESLAVPLQTAHMRDASAQSALKRFQGEHYEDLKEYVESFYGSLTDEVFQDERFSFRVYLIPKIANHRQSSDAAFEFVKVDRNNPEDMDQLRKIALIRDRHVPVANPGKLRPGAVVREVASRLGKTFNMHTHRQAWSFYKVHKPGLSAEGCNVKYCQFDDAHQDYVFTTDWVEFLVKKLADGAEYARVTAVKFR